MDLRLCTRLLLFFSIILSSEQKNPQTYENLERTSLSGDGETERQPATDNKFDATYKTTEMTPTDIPTDSSAFEDTRNLSHATLTEEPIVTSASDDNRNTAGVVLTDEPIVTSAFDDTRNLSHATLTEEPIVTSASDDNRNTAGVVLTDEPIVTSAFDDTRNLSHATLTEEPIVTSVSDDNRNTAGVVLTDEPIVTSASENNRNTAGVVLTDEPIVTSASDDNRNTEGVLLTDKPIVTSASDDNRNTEGVLLTDKPIVTSASDDNRNTAGVVLTDKPTSVYHDATITEAMEPMNIPTVESVSDGSRNAVTVISTEESTVGTVSDRSWYTEMTSPDSQTDFIIPHSTRSDSMIDVCAEYGSCPPEHKVDSWYCRCDDLCQVYNDCCMEYQPTTYSPRQDIYRCVRTDQQRSNFIGMFAIGVCPEHFENATIIDMCLKEDTTSGPPVRSDDLRIFANHFCAICNNVQDVTPLPVQLYNLPSYVNFQELLSLGDFASITEKFRNTEYRVLQDSTNYRSCVNRVDISESPECQKYVNPLVVDHGGYEGYYRNIFCMDNSIRMTLTPSNIICFASLRFSTKGQWKINTLSVIFNFGLRRNQEDEKMCTKWSEEIDDVCSHLPTYVNVEEPMEVVFEASSNQTDDALVRVGLVIMWAHIVPDVLELTEMAIIAKADGGQILKVSMKLVIRKRCFADEIQEMLTKIKERSLNISINSGDNEIKLTRLDGNQVKNFTRLHGFKMFYSIETFFQDHAIKVTTRLRKEICQLQSLTIFSKQIENGLEISGFHCDQEDMPKDRSEIIVHAITTYACFSVSIVAMVPLIIVNRRIDDVMTIPRTNLENLAISLILSNSLFMVGIGMKTMPTVCYGIGIGLHYLFLAVFVFMTIGVFSASIAVNRLRERRNIPQSQVNRTRLLMTLLGLSLPLTVVGTAFAVDRIGPPRWSPGYNDRVCFPTRFPGNIAFFTGPIISMVIVNLLCMIKIIVQVERTKMETRKHLKLSTTFDDLKMYLRLVVLGGALWLIGIVASVLGWDWLDFAFVLSCGLQGFFISVASLTTQEYKRKIKAMFQRT